VTAQWALDMLGQVDDMPLSAVAAEIVLRFSEGSTRPTEYSGLDTFAATLQDERQPLVDIERQLRALSHDGYLRGSVVLLAAAVERTRRPALALMLSRELMDALDPELGVRLAQAVLAMPEVDRERAMQGGAFMAANRLLGDALLERNDPHGAIRHFEAVLAIDVDDRRALRGWSTATRTLERRGVEVEHRSRGLALLDGLDELEVAAGFGVDRYELGRPLGRGRHAVVYQAFDRHVGRDVAIKRLIDTDGPRGPEATSKRALQARFFSEARTLGRVRSPYVVALYDVAPQQRFIALELCRGGNLRLAMRRGFVGPDDLPRIGAQLRAALEAVHAAGAVHRDVKPANLLVREARRRSSVALADFGLAIDPAPTASGARAGTLRYLAPELRTRAQRPSPAADLYAAGVVLLELAMSPSPLPDAFDRLEGPADPASLLPSELDEVWRARLARLLSTAPEERQW